MYRALIIMATLSATVLPAADASGHYYLQNVREVGSELLLKPDGTFEFMLAYGAADYWAKGTWRTQEQAVILNSAAHPDSPPFRLLRSSATSTAAIRVRVLGANGRPAANIDVTLSTAMGPLDARTDSDGIALFPKQDALKSAVFRIRVYQLETEPIALNAAHDDFTFEINGEAITEVRFINERLALNGKTLTMLHYGPNRPMNYVKGQ